jgi:hypothetical protein
MYIPAGYVNRDRCNAVAVCDVDSTPSKTIAKLQPDGSLHASDQAL